jgi:poly(3-hydroxybutyrate) depolymerase
MKQKYSIDSERIFMQGMSMGDLMTSLFARHYGDVLAGAAGSGGATFLQAVYAGGRGDQSSGSSGRLAVPTGAQRHPAGQEEGLTVNRYNRYSGCASNANRSADQHRGEDNLAFYRGQRRT